MDPTELHRRLCQIKTFVFDIDGVMTDGSVLALESGEQSRTFDVKDGYGINRALKMGYNVAVITAQNQVGVCKRLEYLGIQDIYMGASPDGKLPIFKRYVEQKGLHMSEIVFMGDDFPDYSVMQQPILRACPADAVPEIVALSDYVSPRAGGRGAVRDLIEQVMKAQGTWMAWLSDPA
jgi:3-deoxy-D-manno-octulosonate 8-phosphate phosphatase (KDO 8-P phosphatase)